MESLQDKLLIGVAVFLFGAVVTQLWNRFRARLASISWTASAARLALSAEDTRYGKVEVLYNGTPVHNLHLMTVVLHNESNIDLKDVALGMGFQDGSNILVSEGGLVGSLQEFAFEERFLDSWLKATDAKATPEQLKYFWTHRFYKLPVLNRQAAARFGLLVARTDFGEPMLTVSCDHVGVRIRNRAPEELFWGESRNRSALLGFVIALLATLAISLFTAAPMWLAAVAGWFLGGVCILWGALFIKTARYAVRALG